MNEESAAERLRFAVSATAAFVLLTLPRLLLHELWRDEAWLWLVVQESHSFSELFVPLARSGQGNLFPILCYLARGISSSPRTLQILHLVVAGAATFVFTRWAPFRRRERALFVLGYFPFYEYAVISRHYVAGALLVWLACLGARSRRPALALAVTLGLLCQTTVYGFILAVALAAGWLLDRRLRRDDPSIRPIPRAEALAGLALVVAGAIAGLLQLIPLPGTSFAPEWHFAWDGAQAAATLAMPWRAFVPLPRPGLHFWNSNVLASWPLTAAGAGIVTLGFATAVLWRRKAALVTFLVGGAGFLAFGYLKYVGVLRHQGHWWLLLFAALWLGSREAPSDRPSWHSRTLLTLLSIHCAVGAFASWMDLRQPFSNGSAVAELIRRQGLDRDPLLGFREPPAASVALPLGRPLFSPSRGVFTTHPDWGPTQRELGEAELRCAARSLSRRAGRDILLVLNREISVWEEIEPAGDRLGAIVETEDFHLYRLLHERLEASASAAGCEASSAQDRRLGDRIE